MMQMHSFLMCGFPSFYAMHLANNVLRGLLKVPKPDFRRDRASYRYNFHPSSVRNLRS